MIDLSQFLDLLPPSAAPSGPAALAAALPKALLTQYPALAMMDWSRLQSSNGDEGYLSDEYDDPLTFPIINYQTAAQSLT